MRTGWISKSLCLVCLGLSLLLGAAASAESQTSSVLDRVQKVDDPELGELIRVAMEHHKTSPENEALEIMRKVTQSYAQVKLLDQQIRQVARKIESDTGPADIRSELVLAKAELESKLMVELASLREIMGIIPRHAFEQQPVETLNGWLSLKIIDDRVYVLDGQRPFMDYWAERRWKSAGLLPERETLNHIREALTNKSNLPMRINIYYISATKTASEDLHDKIISLARETNTQMEVEVRLQQSSWTESGRSPLYLREGKIKALYPTPARPPDGSPKLLVSGVVNPSDLEQHLQWRLLFPGNVPLKFQIEYDDASALMAKQVADAAQAVAERLGIADVVGVTETLVQAVPESLFVGGWQAGTDGQVQEIELDAGGQSRLTMAGGQSRMAMRTGPQGTVPAPWILTLREIFIDAGRGDIYRGYLNAEGNLVLNRGKLWPTGSWHSDGPPEMIFTKVR